MKANGVVTIADIAQRAGVSKTAVSYAFNEPGRLAPKTVAAIMQIADELGYVPNPIARSMTSGRTGTIGVLVPQALEQMLLNPFFADFLRGIAMVAGEAGYPVLLVPPVKGSVEQAVNSAAVDGFVTLGLETFRPTMHILERRRLPHVMVDSEPTDGVFCVNIDDEQGAWQAMTHVVESGHRRIGILGIRSPQRGNWRKYSGTLQRRMAGYLRALADHGLSLDGTAVQLAECEVSEAGGAAGFQRLRKRGHRPTAIVGMSDLIVIGAMQAARDQQLQIPGDISFVGFDDIPEVKWTRPPLTTVRQPALEKGRRAAASLLRLIGDGGQIEHLVLATELVLRESVAPCSAS